MVVYGYILISVVLSSLKTIIFRKSMKEHWDEWPAQIANNIFGAILVLLFLPLPNFLEISSEAWFWLGLMNVGWIVGCLYAMKAFKYLDVAVSEIFAALDFILVTLVGIFLFHETLSGAAFVGLALILVSIFFHSPVQDMRFNRGILYKVISAFFIALGVLCTDIAADHVDTSTIVTFGYIIAAVVYPLLKPSAIREILPSLRKNRGLILVGTVFGVVGYYCFATAFAMGDLVTTYTVRQTYIVFVFLFGLVILKENEYKLRRCLSCLTSAAGAVIVCQF